MSSGAAARAGLVAAAVLIAAAVVAAGVAAVGVVRGSDPVLFAAPYADAPAAPSPDAARAGQASRGAAGTRPVPAQRWVLRVAAATGVPAPAVRAYAAAALRLRAEQPSCRLGWTTLAGIGTVESAHGTIGGRTLGEDGRSSTPILGPALDGTGDFAAIPAGAEGTRWHTDARWDHAVGPLQFLGSTWARWGADDDGDGLADPHDLDDAAYAAGRYLCASGRATDTGTGWYAAIHSYNHSDAYVRSVYDAASLIAARAG